MTRECRTDGDVRRLRIADFTDHHDIGVLAKNGAEAAGESEIAGGTDGDLRDASQLIFDGILNRQNLEFRGVNALQHGIERGGLATAGWAGGKEEAVRFFNEFGQQGRSFGVETKLLMGQEAGGFFQKAHHEAFAVDGGHGADADVHTRAAMVDLDVPVLGHEALGDVHFRHDFNAGHQRGVELFGRRRLFPAKDHPRGNAIEASPRRARDGCRSRVREWPWR